LLKHLAELNEPPSPLQEAVFTELFEVAEIANFSPMEQETYQNSLKYYRDMNNVVDTSRQEGREEGREEGRLAERSLILDRQRALLLRILPRTVGELPDDLKDKIDRLSLENLEALSEIFWDFTGLEDLASWLGNYQY
jgi:predicted transposase YdaD